MGGIFSVPLSVLRRDLRDWRRNRWRDTKWQSRRYRALSRVDTELTGFRVPCVILTVKPPRKLVPMGSGTYYPLGFEGDVSCVVWCGARRFDCQIRWDLDGVLARWPDEFFDSVWVGIKPGRYKVCWKIRSFNGVVAEMIESIRIGPRGETRMSYRKRTAFAVRRLRRHISGQDVHHSSRQQ